eukprot:COSAG02_NODE_10091_length_2026_cov_30.551529_2_plen_64_part_01
MHGWRAERKFLVLAVGAAPSLATHSTSSRSGTAASGPSGARTGRDGLGHRSEPGKQQQPGMIRA